MVGFTCPERVSSEIDLIVTPPAPLSIAKRRLAAVRSRIPEAKTSGLEKSLFMKFVSSIIIITTVSIYRRSIVCQILPLS